MPSNRNLGGGGMRSGGGGRPAATGRVNKYMSRISTAKKSTSKGDVVVNAYTKNSSKITQRQKNVLKNMKGSSVASGHTSTKKGTGYNPKKRKGPR